MITKILSLESFCAPLAGVISHTALPLQLGEREGESAIQHLANGPLFSPAARLPRLRFQSAHAAPQMRAEKWNAPRVAT